MCVFFYKPDDYKQKNTHPSNLQKVMQEIKCLAKQHRFNQKRYREKRLFNYEHFSSVQAELHSQHGGYAETYLRAARL